MSWLEQDALLSIKKFVDSMFVLGAVAIQKWNFPPFLVTNVTLEWACSVVWTDRNENELDGRNIEFELQAYTGDKFLCFTLFLNFKEWFISPQPGVRLKRGLD